MDKKKLSFEDILNDDPLGLIGEVKPAAAAARTEDERLVASFEEINAFYEKENREPQKGNVQESTLFFRLEGLKHAPGKISTLKRYDRFNLLPTASNRKDYTTIILPESSIAAEPPIEKMIVKKDKPVEIKSIDDILDDDLLGILDTEEDSIFDLKHVSKADKKTTMPDYVARRKRCADFDEFEPLLRKCQVDLAAKNRKLYPFRKEQQIEKGHFFVLKGVLLYVAKVGKKKNKKGKVNARLRCIFENGTESDMLLRSLAAELYKDGRRVTENEEKLLDNFKNITDDDEATGYIYVLQSKSNDPQVAGLDNLFKIGYSSGAVEERIKNAEKEPTYLIAAVHIVATYRTYNFNPVKLEGLLHRFFGAACLDINLFDGDGQLYRPREWFVAPFEVIEQAIQFMLSGEIVGYRYDLGKGEIVGR